MRAPLERAPRGLVHETGELENIVVGNPEAGEQRSGLCRAGLRPPVPLQAARNAISRTVSPRYTRDSVWEARTLASPNAMQLAARERSSPVPALAVEQQCRAKLRLQWLTLPLFPPTILRPRDALERSAMPKRPDASRNNVGGIQSLSVDA
jgi:hypothetical protein